MAIGTNKSINSLYVRKCKLILLLESEKSRLAFFFENNPKKALLYRLQISIDNLRIDRFRPTLSVLKIEYEIMANTYGFLKIPWQEMMETLLNFNKLSSDFVLNKNQKDKKFIISSSKNLKVENEEEKNLNFENGILKAAQVNLLFEIIEVIGKEFGESFVILFKELIEKSDKSFAISNLIEMAEKLKKSENKI